MVAVAAPPIDPLDTITIRQRIALYVQQEKDAGKELADAGIDAVKRLSAEGYAREYAMCIGAWPAIDIWRSEQRHERRLLRDLQTEDGGHNTVDTQNQSATLSVVPTSTDDVPHWLEHEIYDPGTRRWVKFGDLTQEQLYGIRDATVKPAKTMLKEARFYHRVGKALTAGQCVRDRFTEDDLLALHNAATK